MQPSTASSPNHAQQPAFASISRDARSIGSERCLADDREQPAAAESPDVRMELARLSRNPWVQWALTQFTGKALPGQRPPMRRTPWTHLLGTAVCLAASMAASVALLHLGPAAWIFLPLAWAWTAGRARNFMMTIVHHIVHGNFSGDVRLDRGLCEAIAIPLLFNDFDSYYDMHVVGHHGPAVATPDDPEAYLLALGFRPGTSRKALWKHLRRTVVSPAFHLRFMAERLAGCFLRPQRPWRRSAALAFHLAVLGAVAASGSWREYLVAFGIPMTMFYNVSALLQFTSEHRWFLAPSAGAAGRARLAALTFGRFVGEAPPRHGADAGAWLRFWIRMLCVHVPTRVFVWVGDMPQHDAHHRMPIHFDWANAEYARQADVDAGAPGWPVGYTEVWGLGNALDEAFRVISEQPTLEEMGERTA